jgi:hypothetical protein
MVTDRSDGGGKLPEQSKQQEFLNRYVLPDAAAPPAYLHMGLRGGT